MKNAGYSIRPVALKQTFNAGFNKNTVMAAECEGGILELMCKTTTLQFQYTVFVKVYVSKGVRYEPHCLLRKASYFA